MDTRAAFGFDFEGWQAEESRRERAHLRVAQASVDAGGPGLRQERRDLAAEARAWAGFGFATPPYWSKGTAGASSMVGTVEAAAVGAKAAAADLGERVDVWFSAGPHRVLGGPSCDNDDGSTCAIHRVRLRLGAEGPKEVERRDDWSWPGHGSVQVAVAPSGRWASYLARVDDEVEDVHESHLVAASVRGSAYAFVATGGTGPDDADRPQFPAWLGNDVVLFHGSPPGEDNWGKGTKQPGEDWGAANRLHAASRASVEPLGFDPPALLLGPGAGVSEDTSFQDVAVAPDGATVATFGSTLTGEYAGSLRPRVHRGVPNAREAAAGAVETEEFDLGSTHSRRELPIDECHHPAWRPDGARVLCTNYGDYEVFGDLRARPLYQFSRHRLTIPGTWRQADDGTGSGLLFEPPDRGALGGSFSFDGSFGGIFPSCERVTYKFGQWCGSDNYVVVTASCTSGPDSSGDQPPILDSRILLVRLEPFAFWDLTSWVEDRDGLRRGALAGIFPTCSPVPDTLEWGGPE